MLHLNPCEALDCAASFVIARVERWSEWPDLPLRQPQQAGNAHSGTDEDD